MLRDWTNTQELRSASAIIGEAIELAFPDSAEKTIAFAGCGAGGLLDQISLAFGRVVGFDLTFPVLAAARHLLDGNELELPTPRAMNSGGTIVLRRRRADNPSVQLLAMDAFSTAFAGDSIDCIVTSFLLDLLPDPIKLAKEIHRVVCDGGTWINYGPSGSFQSLWRFDEGEGRAFFEAAEFHVLNCNAVRSTYLDLSRDCPSWSFQNHVCYLTVARKRAGSFAAPTISTPEIEHLLDVIPEHNFAAAIIRRQRLGGEKASRLLFQYERFPGRSETLEVGRDVAEILEIVDGRKSIREIARLLEERQPDRAPGDTARVLANFLEQRVLKRRRP
jgi:SAM-dependent methyltransferase